MDDTALRAAVERLTGDHERAQQGIAELQQQIETLIEIMVAVGTLKPGHAELVAKLRRRVEVARKTDRRVWIDFEARIPAPMPSTLIALHRLTARRDS